jgi:hypothetical protein
MDFISCNNGNLKDVFITEFEIIDRFVGNELWLWGNGADGRLGNNSTTNRSSPVQTVSGGVNWRQVSIGTFHSASIKTDGTLWLWGNAGSGRLGDNSSINRSSPVQTVSTGTNWKQVAVGRNNSSAIKTDGTLWLWGFGSQGQLGNNSNINQSSPVQTVSTGNNWKQVSLGSCHAAAIKTDGTLWLWGENSGRLGDNSTTVRSSPVQTVSTGNNWKQVSAGFYFTGAVKTDGTLWIWGGGLGGRLGTNSTIDRSSPVQTISTGNNWKQVALGLNHSAAIKTDGTLWLWGTNSYGALGNNSTTNRSSPVQTVTTGTNWKDISLGCGITGAVKTDGTLWLWGIGVCGVLGNNSTTNR